VGDEDAAGQYLRRTQEKQRERARFIGKSDRSIGEAAGQDSHHPAWQTPVQLLFLSPAEEPNRPAAEHNTQ
jgi:hypothetical protein